VVIDWLRDGESMMAWSASLSLFPEPALRELQRKVAVARLNEVAAEARKLRELLRGQLAEPARLRESSRIWGALNDVLVRGSVFYVLCKVDGKPKLEVCERLERPDQLLIPIAKAIARLIVEENLTRVRACEGVGCSLWFLDQTKAGRRRFCSASVCGNRAKVAAFRSRQRGH
jgi:predicted RNA-binding Zn ribbon-like protein